MKVAGAILLGVLIWEITRYHGKKLMFKGLHHWWELGH